MSGVEEVVAIVSGVRMEQEAVHNPPGAISQRPPHLLTPSGLLVTRPSLTTSSENKNGNIVCGT